VTRKGKGGRLLRRPQRAHPAATVADFLTAVLTYRRASYTTKGLDDPIGKFLKAKKEIISGDSFEGRSFLDASDVMSLEKGQQLVFVQNFMNRPIKAQGPMWFNEPEFREKGLNTRTGSGPKPALPMPGAQIDASLAQASADKVTQAGRAQVQKVLKSPETILLISPQNLQDFSFDPITMSPARELGMVWVGFQLTNHPVDRVTPSPEQIMLLEGGDEIREAVRDRNIIVFSAEDREALLEFAREHQLTIERELITLALDAKFVRENAPDLGHRDGPAFFAIGEERHLGLHLPENPADADHEHAMAYFAELAGYALDESMPHEAFVV
ncbi:hypothetical protein, partial [Tranquillimonas alkanivorans]